LPVPGKKSPRQLLSRFHFDAVQKYPVKVSNIERFFFLGKMHEFGEKKPEFGRFDGNLVAAAAADLKSGRLLRRLLN